MKELLKNFIGQTLRIYTVSGVESYLGTLDEVKEGYVVLKAYFEKAVTKIMDRNHYCAPIST